MTNLIKPIIKLDDAECFYCRTPIRIYSNESDDIELSKEGIPLSSSIISYRLEGICPKCLKRYKVRRNGLGFSITSDLIDLIYTGGKENGKVNEYRSSENEFGWNEPTGNR